jgi:hypothetical protein
MKSDIATIVVTFTAFKTNTRPNRLVFREADILHTSLAAEIVLDTNPCFRRYCQHLTFTPLATWTIGHYFNAFCGPVNALACVRPRSGNIKVPGVSCIRSCGYLCGMIKYFDVIEFNALAWNVSVGALELRRPETISAGN